MEENKEKTLLIIDSNSLIHRSFHALPPLTTKEGKPGGAVYGFLSVLWKALREVKPDFVIACFDYPGPTIRHKEFKKYKAKRPPLAPELKPQIPLVKEALSLLKIPIFEKEGYEADDLIGTIIEKTRRKYVFPKIKIKILTGDLDLLQLVDENIEVLLMKTGEKNFLDYDVEKVKEKYQGLLPQQIVDFKALRGDPSDNIPGVRGIGEKTAIELLKEFKTVKNLYSKIREGISPNISPKTRNLLLSQEDQAFLSYSLASLKKDAEIGLDVEKSRWANSKKEEFIKFLQRLGFKSLIKRFFGEEKESSQMKIIM